MQEQGQQDLAALQQRASELQSHVDRMNAQREVLQAQLQDKTLGPFTMPTQAQLRQLNVDLAGETADLKSVLRQIERLKSQPQVEVPPPPATPPWSLLTGQAGPPPRTFLPWMSDDALTAASFIVLLSVLVPLSIAFSRRLWRRKPLPALNPPGHEEVISRLGRMEHAIDTIAVEVERVAEGQRFVTKVMSERPLQARAAVHPVEPADPALADAQPFLALGPGPVEPIRVAERQKVRPSITPH